MNITNLLNFQSMAIQGAQTQSSELNAFVASSLRTIVEDFFLKMAPSFIIVVSCRRKSPLNFYLNILQHLFNMVDNMIVQLVFINIEKPQLRLGGSRLYNLLLVDSLEGFLDIDINSYTYNYETNEFYHIFLMQRDRYVSGDMEGIFKYCWTFQIINCNIHTQNGAGQVRLYTYFPYTPLYCGNTKPKMINQFLNNSWINQQYFVPKLNNFYGCPLVAIVRIIPPFFNAIRKNGRVVSYEGFELNLISHLSKRMNFTLDIRDYIADNRTTTVGNFALKNLSERSADMALGFYRKRATLGPTYSTTFPHYQNTIVTVIYLKSQTFNTFEVLYYPFQSYAWLSIVACCIIAVLVTRIMRKNRAGSMTTFSMVACSLGIPIKEHPDLYPCSFIFVTMLWSTFILRSMYSGLLYHLFSHDIYRKLPRTIMDVVDQNYRAAMTRLTFNDIDSIPYYREQRRDEGFIINSSEATSVLPYLEENRKKRLFGVLSKDFLFYYTEIYRKPGSFYIIPEDLLQQQLCIYLRKHSFLINQFDREILNIQSIGLIELWSKSYINSKYFETCNSQENEVINQDDLWGIYIICAAFQLLALVIFIIEKLSIKYRFLRKLFE